MINVLQISKSQFWECGELRTS